MKKFILLILFFLCTVNFLFGQKQWYTAFTNDPTKLSDTLYLNLQNPDFTKKLEAIKDLADAHLRAGSTDSILFYGKYLNDQVNIPNKEIINREDYQAQAHLILGYGYYMMGLNDEAMASFIRGIELNNDLATQELKMGLSLVYRQNEDYDKALNLLSGIDQSSHLRTRIRAKKYLADLLLELNKDEEAKHLYLEILKNLEPNQQKLKLESELQIGIILAKNKAYDQALSDLHTVMNASREHDFYDVYIASVIETGKIYAILENFHAAQLVLSTGHINAVNWNRLGLEREVIRESIKVYVKQKDYQNAYALMTQYVGVTNQIKNKQSKFAYRDLEIKYETKLKENEILNLKETQLLKESEVVRQKTIKNAILIGFLVLLIPIIGFLTLYYQKLQVQSKLNAKNEEVNRKEIATLIKNQELKLMKSSVQAQNDERSRIAMELHDSIGGNLAAIKLQLNEKDQNQKELIKKIDNTYQHVREISHNLTPSIFVEQAFTTLVNEYVEGFNKSELTEVKFIPFPREKVDELDELYKIELYKVLQELLTNSIKYAQAKSVEIYLNVIENSIQFLYEDDGVGFDVNLVKKGLGLENIKKRIIALDGTINIDSKINHGMAMSIEIPIIK